MCRSCMFIRRQGRASLGSDRDAGRRIYASGDREGRRRRGAVAERTWRDRVCAGVPAGAAVPLPFSRCWMGHARCGMCAATRRSLAWRRTGLGCGDFRRADTWRVIWRRSHDGGASGAADPIERVSDRPDFAILSYGRFSMDDSIPRKTNMEGLLGDHPTRATMDAVSVVKLVTKSTRAVLYLFYDWRTRR